MAEDPLFACPVLVPSACPITAPHCALRVLPTQRNTSVTPQQLLVFN